MDDRSRGNEFGDLASLGFGLPFAEHELTLDREEDDVPRRAAWGASPVMELEELLADPEEDVVKSLPQDVSLEEAAEPERTRTLGAVLQPQYLSRSTGNVHGDAELDAVEPKLGTYSAGASIEESVL